MAESDRIEQIRRRQGQALVRALHESELKAAGAARNVALHEAELALDRIARLLPDALQAGLTLSEIARITDVSRPTLYQLRGRYGDAGDLRLAVLQTVASRGEMAQSELADIVGRDPKEVAAATSSLFDEGLLEPEPFEDEDRVVAGAVITQQGFEALQGWHFSQDVIDGEIEP